MKAEVTTDGRATEQQLESRCKLGGNLSSGVLTEQERRAWRFFTVQLILDNGVTSMSSAQLDDADVLLQLLQAVTMRPLTWDVRC